MLRFTQSTTPSKKPLLVLADRCSVGYCITLILTYMSLLCALPVHATSSDENAGASSDSPALTLVFSDDFSTDPNTNGQWTIHRSFGDPNSEAVWDSTRQAWALTRAEISRGV